MVKRTSRRNFIKTSTVAGAGFMALAGSTARIARASALQSIAVASVGVGGKGAGDLKNASYYGKIVALCDVDSKTLNGAGNSFPDAKKFTDFREMFAAMGDKFDACTISTPDHMHTVITAMAMKAKKHCYTQKPLTRTIYEARYLGELAKKTGVCTQMGNQGSSFDTMRNVVAQVKKGVIGEIKEVHVWTNRPVWPQGPNRDLSLAKFSAKIKKDDPDIADDEIAEKKKQIDTALKTLNWDLWLGVAPQRDYWPGIYHPFSWRGWWDFGTGSLGDMACHTVNMPYGACDLKFPTSVVAESSGHDFNSFPAVSKIWFEFPANDWRGAIPFTWYDSKVLPPAEIFDKYGIGKNGVKMTNSGSIIIGEKGVVYSPDDYAAKYHILAEGGKAIPEIEGVEFRAAPKDERSGSFDTRNQLEWFTAIWENKPELCWSNFPNHAGPLTETILLGNLAVWAAPQAGVKGEKIEWDAVNLKVTNLDKLKTPGVAELVHPKYKEGYEQI
ncbi:MAG: Gfo/Idh/MocA family oxidoreductase [Planctomycetia bacterium]|nr:Gfo/Idh/MocA family oxidoreductase [Planctomycetia bacterium]